MQKKKLDQKAQKKKLDEKGQEKKIDGKVQDRLIANFNESLENGNLKQALKDVKLELERRPHNICFEILKARCKFLLGEKIEAFTIVDGLDVAEAQFDAWTVKELVNFFRDARLPDRISILYERVVNYAKTEQNVVNHYGRTEYNMVELYMSYVRTHNFDMQRKTALAMVRLWHKPQHRQWVIMASMMKAKFSDMHPALTLMLADKHLSKLLETKSQSLPEVELSVMMHESMGRPENAADILKDPEVIPLFNTPPSFTMARRLKLMVAAKQLISAFDTSLELVKENFDDWALWTIALDTVIAISEDETISSAEKIRVQTAMELLLTLEGEARVYRGLCLARLQYISRLKTINVPIPEKLGGVRDLIVFYIKHFFKKPCCYIDIVQYFDLIDKGDIGNIFNEINNLLSGECDGKGLQNPDIYRGVILLERLRLRLGLLFAMNRDERRSTAGLMVKDINKPDMLELNGGDIAQLYAATLWKEWEILDDWQSFFEMILLLEWTANKFPADPYSKLVLSRAYAHIGHFDRVYELSALLDIKSVQRDTLGYFIFPVYELCGRYRTGVRHFDDLRDMFIQADFEITECIATGYRNSVFAQIPGLVELHQKMEKSGLGVGGRIFHRYLMGLFVDIESKDAADTLYGDEETIDWKSLADNRDLTVVPSYEPGNVREKVDITRETTQRELGDITQLRLLLSRSIGLAGRHNMAELRDTVSLFVVHLEHCKLTYAANEIRVRLMQSPTPMRLSQWVHGGSLSVVVRLLQAVVEVAVATAENRELLPDMLPSDDIVRRELDDMLPSSSPKLGPFFLHESLFAASRALQGLAACRLLIQLIEKYGSVKKNQKSLSTFLVRCQTLQTVISNVAGRLRNILDSLRQLIAEPGNGFLPDIGNDWSEDLRILLESKVSDVKNSMIGSYMTSLEDMISVIDQKWCCSSKSKLVKGMKNMKI